MGAFENHGETTLQAFVEAFHELSDEFILESTSIGGGAMAAGRLCWGKAIVDDSEMAGVAAIGAIFGKGVFRGTTSKKQKSSAEIGLTVSTKESASVVSTKLEADVLEGTGKIKDDSVSGSS